MSVKVLNSPLNANKVSLFIPVPYTYFIFVLCTIQIMAHSSTHQSIATTPLPPIKSGNYCYKKLIKFAKLFISPILVIVSCREFSPS